jgi:hypothetical protein
MNDKNPDRLRHGSVPASDILIARAVYGYCRTARVWARPPCGGVSFSVLMAGARAVCAARAGYGELNTGKVAGMDGSRTHLSARGAGTTVLKSVLAVVSCVQPPQPIKFAEKNGGSSVRPVSFIPSPRSVRYSEDTVNPVAGPRVRLRLPECREYVAVGAEGQCDRGVTEETLDDLWICPCQQVQRGARMAHIMEPNIRNPRLLDEALERIDF